MGLRWRREVLILSQPKRYLDDRSAKRVNTGLYRLVRLVSTANTGLKIRCPKGRAGSTPALGTTYFSQQNKFHQFPSLVAPYWSKLDEGLNLAYSCFELDSLFPRFVFDFANKYTEPACFRS